MKKIIKKYCLYILVLIFFVIQSCAEDEILNPEKEPPEPDPPQTHIRLVPQQYSTIQSAILASNDHDTVLVSPGIYYENINFLGKDILVQSSGSAENTIIDGSQSIDPNNSSVVSFISGESDSSILSGFTITGGKGTQTWDGKVGGGIFIADSKPIIRNCIICDNISRRGGGIAIRYGITFQNLGAALIENCVVYNNTATEYYGGGIFVSEFGMVKIDHCTIIKNFSVGATNLALMSTRARLSPISNSIFWDGTISGSTNNNNYNYCNIQGGWPSGIGNINLDPMFCNAALNNFRVASNSPCVGAGENGCTIGAFGTCGQEYRRFDYPLEIGTTWKYSYSYSSSHMGEWWYRRGIHFWTVVDSSALSNDIVRFSIKSVNYDSTASNYNPTVRHIIDSLIFYIDVGFDVVVVRPPSYVSGIEDNIQGYFSGSDSIKIGGRTYTEQIGLTNMLHENLTNSFYREKQQLIEFNKKRK